MIVLFWCSTCRSLYDPGAVLFTDDAGATMITPRCARCSQPVEFRGIPDDPDDPQYGLPRCATCRGEVRASSRFCPRCGAPLLTGPLPALPTPPTLNHDPIAERDRAGQATGYRSAAQLVVRFARQRQHRQLLAGILELLADPPNYRRQPRPGDLAGDFDGWFDGGAVRYLTSIVEYHFADGVRASIHDLSMQTVHVLFPDGAQLTIEEPPAQPSFADRVLAAVVEECQRMLQSIQGEGILPSTGRPPTQCMIVENRASGGWQEWLYDLGTNRLIPYAIGVLDMTREPVNGMYFQRGLVQYRVVEDQRALEFSCTLGPRFGRGLRFELVDAPEGVQLREPTLLWIS
jgi:hypothetical protein